MSQSPNDLSVTHISADFLEYARAELGFGPQTLDKYKYCLGRLARFYGDSSVTSLGASDLLHLKSWLIEKQTSNAWQIVMLSSLKRLLRYCRDHRKLQVLDPAEITLPKRPRREVLYLTPDEVARFVAVIPLETRRGKPHRQGVRFRALVEVLLGSAMRIGETLSLNRSDVDFERKEGRVIGKGNKERIVFFTDRALYWLKRYLDNRTDCSPALFTSMIGVGRLSRTDIWRPFAAYRKLAGLHKPVRPHLLRHTAATQLLFNGCPVGHIKEILGHERLETTCRYYLGLDRRQAQAAHRQYLIYSADDMVSG